MIITTAHAKLIGWQHVEFDDGLGFRPCTAVCAWNPEFRYRQKEEVKKQIKWSDLPIGTRVVDAWGTELEYRGAYPGSSLAFEYYNTGHKTITSVSRYPTQLVKLAPRQNWLANSVFPTGVLWYSHQTLDGLKCIVRIADGYELC